MTPGAEMLLNLEDARLAVVLCILVITSYTDIRRRELTAYDRPYLIAGGACFAVFMVAEGGWQDTLAWFSVVVGMSLALGFWRLRVMGNGDVLIIVVISVSLPEYGGIPFVPAGVVLLGFFMIAFLAPMYNLVLNASHYVMPRGRPPLFAPYPRAGFFRRAGCMFTAHAKRPWEKFVVPVKGDGNGSFTFWNTTPVGNREWGNVETGRLVMVGVPIIPFFLSILILTVIASQYLTFAL